MSKKFGKSRPILLKSDGSNDKVDLESLEAQFLSKEAANSVSQIQIYEQKLQMRWLFIGIIVLWITLGLISSIILFVITRSNLSFIPLTGSIYSSPQILNIIARFLFWGPEDYQLEKNKMDYKQKVQEAKYRYKYHYDKKESLDKS